MKILIINPNSDEMTNERIRKKAADLACKDYDIDVVSLTGTPKLISRYEDYAKGIPEMLDIVKNRTEYDAFIVACHSDPNLDLMKEVSDKPVVGIAEASMKIASMECHGFSIISPSVSSIPKKWDLARKYHCEDLYKGAVVCSENDEVSLCEAARQAVERYYTDGIVLGCANYTNADRYIEKKLGVKVFDGVACAVIVAAGLVMYHAYKR